MVHSVKIMVVFAIALMVSCCTNRTKPARVSSAKTETTGLAGDDLSGRRVFQKRLTMKNFDFDISATGEGSIQQLVIRTHGLTNDTAKIKLEVVGHVKDAEISDLNSDGFPEILIYTTSAGSGSYGDVIGYSVNKGKSISRITFPKVSDNAEAGKGYMGHDQFRIERNRLVQSFQLYNPADANATPTGNIRQIQYKLTDGESSGIFVIDKIIEIPAN